MRLSKGALAVSVGASFLFLSVAQAVKQVISEEELGYRNSPIYEEGTAPPPVEFPTEPPGSGKKLARAYENAPPQIPHSVEGFVPIKPGQNACLGCHMPEVAKSVGATPIPKTHIAIDLFTKGGKKKELRIDPARYQCVMCHAVQAKAKPLVKNLFKPEFRDPQAKKRSTLFERWKEGLP
ncbi:MAG TPA: nitrate reductase cytochrome c-type subunit; periplasmic nitrate reductase electron transfer subunit [Aquificaceae bacterium]|nr:nitrate reductase cytochrome c-type subunit; periplasmic nitrate reductase electron transfer subunit [Aquificaceae bacterium]HIQ30737.1 nitrate reductase cytochrome c-type subunit; periplasmic nitrate reductase electron transfer subunit [Aquifex aeolicus]